MKPLDLRTSPLSFSLALATALGVATASACKSDTKDAATSDGSAKSDSARTSDEAEGGKEQVPAPEADEGSQGEGTGEDDKPAPVARASAASPTGGKGAKSLGFNIGKISHLFALEATPSVPKWAAKAESSAALTRDDKLDTAWTCRHGQDQPCALGLSLPEPAKVEALRLFTADGPRYRDYKGSPRVAEVRVHTDAGWVDAKLADGANHVYVRFDAPIETRTLAVEVRDIHPGKGVPLVRIAELEVYGTEGVPRPPIELDPAMAWVSWETDAWSSAGDDHTIRQVFVNFGSPSADPSGDLDKRRFIRATGVFGRAGDDYLLFERLFGTDCVEQRGNYMLYDTRSRMLYALGDLGGAGAEVYRHESGSGFAIGWTGPGQFTVKGIVEEAGKLVWKRPPRQAPEDPKAQLQEWGFDPIPLSRGATHEHPPDGCRRAEKGEVTAEGKLSRVADEELAAAKWLVCSVGGDQVVASDTCNSTPMIAMRSGGEEFLGESEEGRSLRVRRSGDLVFFELATEKGGSSSLYLAQPGSLIELEAAGGLFVRPPAACSACEDQWARPGGSRPDASEVADEGDDAPPDLEDLDDLDESDEADEP